MFPSRRTLLLVSAVSALVFVGARVLYRVIFGGASIGATGLPSLPLIQLGGPFSHITLFGPLSVEGLARAALSALPFAGVIFLMGALVALVDPRNLIALAPRLRWGSSVVLALGIAVSTFPAVLQSVSAVRRTSRLRGIKPRLASFVAILETTLERALGVALALECRGIRSQRAVVTRTGPNGVVSLQDFCVPGRFSAAVTWEVRPGSRIVLTGATGQGKTTVLESIAGVLDVTSAVSTRGLCDVGCVAADIAYVPHDPRTLFLASRVRDDVALGLVARGHRPASAREIALGTLTKAGLSHLSHREPHELSSGEAALVALVMVLVTQPTLVLLDEPLSALDETSRVLFLEILHHHIQDTGVTVVMTDHPRGTGIPAGWDPWHMGAEGIGPGYVSPHLRRSTMVPYRQPEPDVVLRVSQLTLARGDHDVLRDVDCVVRRGEVLLITGDNGAGKSTLLDALAAGDSGVTIGTGGSVGEMSLGERVASVALVPSEPRCLFMTSSVAEELLLADKTAGVTPGFSEITCESLMPGLATNHRGTHPRDLSRGQQAALAIALQMSHKPAVLLLDEPTRGLDADAERAFAEVVGCVVETGTAVVIAAHHRDATSVPATRVLVLDRGTLSPLPSEVSS